MSEKPPLAQRLEEAAGECTDSYQAPVEEYQDLMQEAAKELRNAEAIIIDNLSNQGCMDQAFTWQLRVCGEPEKPKKTPTLCWGTDCDVEAV